jgi:tetratricopeptide (TPR) repeat protein
VQAGSAAAMAGQYDKAIEKLEAALSMNPNLDLAKKNLAVAANNLAISAATQPDKEIHLLHLALFWEPTNQAARQNLNSLLQSQNKDPKSFAIRVSIADQCASANDPKGATVEYREALAIKDDPAIRSKLNALKPSH